MHPKRLKKILRRLILALFFLIVLIFGQGRVHQREGFRISFPFGKKYDYSNILVSKVIDGDTIRLENGEKVRLIGIDTPEMYESDKLFRDARRTGQDIKVIQKMGREAAVFTRYLCEGKIVRLEFDVEKRDQYSRLLAYVFLEDGTFVNAKIVEEGYANLMIFPPNVKYASLFRKLYKEAKENNRGLWK